MLKNLESEVKYCKQKELQALEELERARQENMALSEELVDVKLKLKSSSKIQNINTHSIIIFKPRYIYLIHISLGKKSLTNS